MKKLINLPIEFDIVVTYFPEVISDNTYVAAGEFMGYHLPDGPLLPGDKNAVISEQDQSNYNAFIETLEDFLTDTHNLELVYNDNPTDYSHYYSFFAKDDNGKVLFKFKIRLRISNHDPHRTDEQRANKAKEKKVVDTWMQNHPDYNGKTKPTPLTYIINVNDRNPAFTDYTEAFIYIYNEVNRWLEIMRR